MTVQALLQWLCHVGDGAWAASAPDDIHAPNQGLAAEIGVYPCFPHKSRMFQIALQLKH
jgi:hypothetical protein